MQDRVLICDEFLWGVWGKSFISGSLRCVGTSLSKTLGFDKHSEVMHSCSVWHSDHDTLGMRYICCTIGMCRGLL